MTSSLSQKVQFLLTAQVYAACLYRTLTQAEGRVGLADQRYRFKELQISSDAGEFWGQQAIVIR
jgi:hypothetical protein